MGTPNPSSVHPPANVDEVTVGTVIAGKYRLDAHLGRGGMGTVWACTHLALGDRMAVKIVSTSNLLSADVRARFAREARATARLKSRFSVQVFDSGELPHGTPYIVMEYLEGETLNQYLRRTQRIPLEETVGILVQVARGLQRAHEAGLIHRDIKPGNIFLAQTSDDGRVAKVFDFGVVKLLDAPNATQTVAGMFVGTPQFMSPEQAMGRSDVDHRTDIYSLGVLAFRMLTGSPMYAAPSVPALLLKICTGPVPSLAEHVPELPDGVQEWLERTCARDRESRHNSAIECVEDLLGAASMSASNLLAPDSLTTATSGLRNHSGAIRIRMPDAPTSSVSAPLAPSPIATSVTPGGSSRPWLVPLALVVLGGAVLTLAAAVWHSRSVGDTDRMTAVPVSPQAPAPAAPPGPAAASNPTAGGGETGLAAGDPPSPQPLPLHRGPLFRTTTAGAGLDRPARVSSTQPARVVTSGQPAPVVPLAQGATAAAPAQPAPAPAARSPQAATGANSAITDVGF